MSDKKTPRRRVVIVDNHPLVRRGLSELINNEPGLEVSAASGTRGAALKAITTTSADLVITGLSLSGGFCDGLTLVADIRGEYPNLPVLVLSMRDESRWSERAIRVGANGFLSKTEIDATLLDAIHNLLD